MAKATAKKDERTKEEIAEAQLHLEAERDYQTQHHLDTNKRIILLERAVFKKEPAKVDNNFRHPPSLPVKPEVEETEAAAE